MEIAQDNALILKDNRKKFKRKRQYFRVFLLSFLAFILGFTALTALDTTQQAVAKPMDTAAWDQMAQCESGGDWSIDNGNGFSGGLQFTDQTWKAFGGTEFAPKASKATKEQQIYVATKVAQKQGLNAWPTCSAKLSGYEVPKSLPEKPGKDSTPAATTTSPKPANDPTSGTSLAGLDNANVKIVDDSVLGDGGQASENGGTSKPSTTAPAPESSPNQSASPETSEAPAPSDSTSTATSNESTSPNTSTAPTTGSSPTTGTSSNSNEPDGELYDPYSGSKGQAPTDSKFSDTAYASPLQVAIQAREQGSLLSAAEQYLSFGRWKGATGMPEGDLSTQATVGISNFNTTSISNAFGGMLIAAGAFFTYLMGMLLALMLQADILGSGLFMADLLFARIINSLLWTTGSGGVKILTSVLAGLILIFLYKMFFLKTTNAKDSLKPILLFVLSIIAVGIIGNQAKNNHANEFSEVTKASEVGKQSQARLSGNEPSIIDYGSISSNSSANPKNWAILSPGWAVSYANSVVIDFGNIVNDMTQTIFKAISNGASSSQNKAIEECDIYHKASQAVFSGTKAAKDIGGASLLVAFDNVSYKLINQSYRLAAFGDTEGAGGSWCRFAEMQTNRSAAEQAMISRVAGLYTEVVGTGGLGFVDNNEASIVNYWSSDPTKNGINIAVTPGRIVDNDGTWLASSGDGENEEKLKNGVKAASNFFGPVLPNNSAIAEAKFYFAGCYFAQGRAVELRPEWKGVTRAYDDSPLKTEDCTGSIVNGEVEKGGFGQRNGGKDSGAVNTSMAWNFSAYRDDSDANEDNVVEKGAKKVARFFKLDKVYDAAKAVGGFFGVTSDGSDKILAKFDNAESDGRNAVDSLNVEHKTINGNAPRNFWKATNGKDGFSSLIYGLLAAVGGWKLGTTLLTVVGGAFIGQVIALIVLIAIAMFFLFILLPVDKIRGLFKTGFLVVGASLIVTTVLTLILGFTITFATFIEALLSPRVEGVRIFQAVITLLAFYFTFKAILMIASSFLSIDLTTRRGLLEAGIASGSPALRELGANVVSPFDKKFFNKNSSTDAAEQHAMRKDPRAGTLSDLSSEKDVLRKQQRKDKAEELAAKRKARAKNLDKFNESAAGIGGKLGNLAGRAAGTAIGGGASGGTAAAVGNTVGGKAGSKLGRGLGHLVGAVPKAAVKAGEVAHDAPGNVSGYVKDKAGKLIPIGTGAESIKGAFAALGNVSQSMSGKNYDENNENSKGNRFIDQAWGMFAHPASTVTPDELAENVHTVLGTNPVLTQGVMQNEGGQRFLITNQSTYEEALKAAPGVLAAPANSEEAGHAGITDTVEKTNSDIINKPLPRLTDDASFQEMMKQADQAGTLLGHQRRAFQDEATRNNLEAVNRIGNSLNAVQSESGLILPNSIANPQVAEHAQDYTSSVTTIPDEELNNAVANNVSRMSGIKKLTPKVVMNTAKQAGQAILEGKDIGSSEVWNDIANNVLTSADSNIISNVHKNNPEVTNGIIKLGTRFISNKLGSGEFKPNKSFD